MSELMLVNPRKRKRRSGGKRKMSALQKKYFGGGRKRRAPKKRRYSGRGRRAAAVAAPRTSRRRRSGRTRRARTGIGGGKFSPMRFLKGSLMPAAIGGGGALAIDVIWNLVPIPAGIKSGPMAPFVKVAGAVAVGMLASKVAGREIGAKVTAGYLTVFAYNMLRGVVQKAMPSLPLGDYPDLGYVQAGPFLPDASLEAYIPDTSGGMGAYLNDAVDYVS